MRFLILGLLCCLFCVKASADSWAAPGARIFSSEDGERAMKVVPIREGRDAGKSNATLFRLNPSGSEDKSGEWRLVNTPMRVLIPDSSININYFVTLDTWANVGREHVVVIYDNNGRLLHDLKLEDFLTPIEQMEHVRHSVSSSWWREGATFSFEVPETRTETPATYDEKLKIERKTIHVTHHPEKTRLNIVFPWGKKVSIELATGKVENAA